MNPLIFLLQNYIINNLKINNMQYDFIINIITIIFIPIIFTKMQYIQSIIKYYLKKIFKKRCVEIIIDSQNHVIDRCGIKITKFSYSKAFQAITYYIKDVKPKDIYSKREPDKHEKDNNPVFDLFIPDQNKPFLLDSNKKIYCTMQMIEDLYETNKDKADLKRKHSIRIFSTELDTTIQDIENFIENCLTSYKKYNLNKTINEQYYFSYNYWDEEGRELMFSEKIFQTNRTFDTVFFEEKNIFLNNINFFLNNEEWYNKKGIPYHYGVLLHGLPGCGKTSIIKSLLAHTKRNALVIPLNRVKTCGELENIFFQSEINNKNIPTNKRIYIFEDIDCLCNITKDREKNDTDITSLIFNGEKINMDWQLLNKLSDITTKKNSNPDDELNLSCLLNIFDGILEMPGRIIILTTNYPDKIDKALLRPGRIDFNIELKKASLQIIYDILSNFYDIDIDKIKDICNEKKYELKEYKYTPAFITNLCQNYIYNLEESLSILSK
jgi:hypothetical protein